MIGISGSGNSKNVLRSIDYANKNGGTTVGLCGYSGGKLYKMADIPILARVDDMQKVEDIHMIVTHMSMQRIMQELARSAPEEWPSPRLNPLRGIPGGAIQQGKEVGDLRFRKTWAIVFKRNLSRLFRRL